MTVAKIADLLNFAQNCFKKAKKTAKEIGFKKFAEVVANTKAYGARLLADEPGYSEVETFQGIRAWGAMLSFDLRRSTARALEVGSRDTFLTMHTYLPTMLSILDSAGGIVVGLRGDGAIACFGQVDLSPGDVKVTDEQAERAMYGACDCGDAMVKAIDAVVNKVLVEAGVKGGLQIGVGIDVGEFVATNIGLGGATDLTAYGNCVNKCCKRSNGNNTVMLTLDAKNMFPQKPGGRTTFRRHPTETDAFILEYPNDYQTLK